MKDKPLILAIKETEDNIIKVINESGIPAFFINRIFERLGAVLKTMSDEEIKQASESYNEEKKQENGGKKE